MPRFMWIALLGLGLIWACQPSVESNVELTDAALHTYDFPDSLSARRISFVLAIRKRLAEKYWPEFGLKRSEGPFIYFNDSLSEVFFPNPQVLERLERYQSYSEDYVLSPRTDTLPYHFELMLSLDSSDRDRLYYNNPVQQFLSPEQTAQYIPYIESTEFWTTLVIHEMFHHFQYNHEGFMAYSKASIAGLPIDIRNLQALANEDSLYYASIRNENTALLQALAASDIDSLHSHAQKFMQWRKQRIESYQVDYPDLEKVENYYFIQEGSARYMEYLCIQELAALAKEEKPMAIADDPYFQNYQGFEEVGLESENFSWLSYEHPSTYHYALGFNLMRLLDRLEVPYHESLLHNPGKDLTAYLEGYFELL